MKKYFLLIILAYAVQYIIGDNFLSKFHQNDYKMKDIRMQLTSFDKSFYNFYEIKAFKYNRTTTAHNMTWNYKVDVKDKIELVIQAYKFLSNEYRDFSIRFQVNLQKCFKANIAGIVAATRCGNFTNCIFRKDVTYHICNFVVDESQFPPLIPTGKYRISGVLLYFNREISTFDLYTEVYRPIPYPKK